MTTDLFRLSYSQSAPFLIHDLVNRYGISVSQMTTDLFRLLYSQSAPFLIHDLVNHYRIYVSQMTTDLGADSEYNKQNRSVVICDTDIL
jgi:hypothetical protein